MAGDKVKTYFYIAFMSFIEKLNEIGICSEARVGRIVVDYVISAVLPSGSVGWIEPYSVDTQGFDIIEARNDSLYVADSVSV